MKMIPCCGRTPSLETRRGSESEGGQLSTSAYCEVCDSTTWYYHTMGETIEAWNEMVKRRDNNLANHNHCDMLEIGKKSNDEVVFTLFWGVVLCGVGWILKIILF